MDLTPSNENYLKHIWQLSEWPSASVENSGAAPKDIAERMELSPSTVSEGIKTLAALGLVHHHRYGNVSLTPKGTEIALNMVRKHRLIETFLVAELGYGWDEVHAEAEALEHTVSDIFIERIDKLLGYPTHDPHGDSIPSASGKISRVEAVRIADLSTPGEVEVVRVSDKNSEILSYLADMGIKPHTTIKIASLKPALGIISVDTGQKQLDLSFTIARQIWVRQP